MKVFLPYGKSNLEIHISEERVADIATAREASELDFPQDLYNAVENSLGGKRFSNFLKSDTLFIVNDGTRPTPTAQLLNYLNDNYRLLESGAKFMVATGAHRAPTQEEFDFIFGSLFNNKQANRVKVHDARESPLTYLGKTSQGTPVKINKEVLEAQRIVIITSVEPHYFAGFTGGRKSILPGVSGFETIEQNHSQHYLPGAEPLELEENPINNDFVEALEMLDKDIFAINTVLDKNGTICSIKAGDINRSFQQAVEKAKEIFVASIEEKADIVVTAAPYPMDVDLYQAHKALENGKLALKDNGVIILVAQCRKGVGDDTFLNLLTSFSNPSDVIKKARRDYKLGYQKSERLARLTKRAEIWGVTDLPSNVSEKAYIRPLPDLQPALDQVLSTRPGQVLFLPEGSVTVPQIT